MSRLASRESLSTITVDLDHVVLCLRVVESSVPRALQRVVSIAYPAEGIRGRVPEVLVLSRAGQLHLRRSVSLSRKGERAGARRWSSTGQRAPL